MTDTLRKLRINSDRMLAAFNELAQIGSTGDGGVNRPSLSEAHLAARQWFREQIEKSGLEFRTDGAGNHSAVLNVIASSVWAKQSPVPLEIASSQQSLLAMTPTLLLGSHLDSVPYGGRFDGGLGWPPSACWDDHDAVLPRMNSVIDFTDEEGTLVGLLGSAPLQAVFMVMFCNPRGGREALVEGMKKLDYLMKVY
jgi:N-carbamoyl-L-amino-acid hydrolase